MTRNLTSGNVAGNNHALLKKYWMLLSGCCVGDKAYYIKLFDLFFENGFHLITKPRKNMIITECGKGNRLLPLLMGIERTDNIYTLISK